MPKNPQCPRCGDNVTPLRPTAWRPANGDLEYHDLIATRGVCDLCLRAIAESEAVVDDTQDRLRAAVAPKSEPAFARAGFRADVMGDRFDYPPQAGMSLRDYYAGCALQGLTCGDPNCDRPARAFELAKAAYMVADAMIAARCT